MKRIQCKKGRNFKNIENLDVFKFWVGVVESGEGGFRQRWGAFLESDWPSLGLWRG
jgi:hypothetical protein